MALTTLLLALIVTAGCSQTSGHQTPLRNTHTSPPPSTLLFEARHEHAVSTSGHVVFADIPAPQADSLFTPGYNLHTRPVLTHRARSPNVSTQSRATRTQRDATADFSEWWDEDEVPGPDVEKRETLLLLAKMTDNAYLRYPNNTQWYDLGGEWNISYRVGWEPDADGFRGHVFATPDNSTVVLSIKGTSAPYLGEGGPTVTKDKLNDNLLFSCCCAHVDWSWSTVCGCSRGGWKCDQDCLEEALIEDSLFYPIGINLYNNITYMYPDSNIWVIGHSLGGALASLLGATFGAPVVAFESPGEKMASKRLHLPQLPSTQHITHVYNTADSIAMGACTGVLSLCYEGGYAMETRCHLGQSIVYDTVTNLGWSVGIKGHFIVPLIEEVLGKEWGPAVKEGREVPEARTEDDCVECYRWEFGSFPKRLEL